MAAERRRGRARVTYLSGRVGRVARHRWDILTVIAVGGAIGSLARWETAQLLPHRAGTFPRATFLVNVTGCFLIGPLTVLLAEAWPPSRYARPFLGIGILGGFTTFSTYMLDARSLILTHHAALAGEYVVGSLAAGLTAVWAGIVITRLALVGLRRRSRSLSTRRSS